ncbi:hypoxanthine phosphoribosyltransferase [Thiospirochaeta perfilievii]|uniref:Hypoxanthine phosphoribosyltransferase n=1 Tax=Thiospirochaeta perfilievii TaxID=252967 RepID=A0A5C1Q7S0_9SPIO|nr:hypoxanthine phosphoribosyltransferase [Thiospirochaeta perfilievii]QEN04075.1 hypoxanthine phosphoribosyltransferase [Thiospirochaeta perfilievii]
MNLPKGIESILIDKETIESKVTELANIIDNNYKDIETPLVVIGLLKGSFIFMSDLVKQMQTPLQVDFMIASSYGDSMENTEVSIIKDIETHISGRHVLIVEDIIDTGITLTKIENILSNRNPKSMKICTLLNKPSRRTSEVNIDFNGFDIDDHFVGGMGLDYAQKYRNLPYIGVVKNEKL